MRTQSFPGSVGIAAGEPVAGTEIDMKLFPREKHRIDFLGLATRKERNPWLAGFYLVVGVLLFGYIAFEMIAARL